MRTGSEFTNQISWFLWYLPFTADVIEYHFNPRNNEIETYDEKMFEYQNILIPKNKTLLYCVCEIKISKLIKCTTIFIFFFVFFS